MVDISQESKKQLKINTSVKFYCFTHFPKQKLFINFGLLYKHKTRHRKKLKVDSMFTIL